MANCCKDCDRLQPQTSGSAPLRPSFHQPTMYDHFQNFQKFKQAKDEEEYVKARKMELSKFDASFTDWQLNMTSSMSEFEQFSTQDIARFRQQLRLHNNCELSVIDKAALSPPGETNTDDDTKPQQQLEPNLSIKKKVSLLTISRTPVECPVGLCKRTIGVTSVLSHYLRDHSEDFGVQCQEIHRGKRSILVFDPTTLDFRDNICLGVLAYGGDMDKGIRAKLLGLSQKLGLIRRKKRLNRPAERGICMHNAFLPKPHEHLDAHLPILIMACKTSWSAMLDDKGLEEKITNCNDVERHILVLWLVSVQTTKPIHCTVTVYDKSMTSSRSTIMRLRHLSESQNPSEFLHQDPSCLRLSRGEINILTREGQEAVHMEVMINEYDN